MLYMFLDVSGPVVFVGGGFCGVGWGAKWDGRPRGRREKGLWWEKETGDKRLREIVHKHRCTFAHRGDCVLLDLGVGREDAFGEALDHGSWE